MGRFRKNGSRKVPALNTASLPDLIFTLLFFFLLVTNMRTVPPLTHFHLPTALELQKLKEKSLLIYIIIGKQINNEQDNLFEIQLDSGIVTLEELALKLRTIIDEKPPEEQDKTVVVLKADRDVEMGLVNDIRQILRDVRLLTVYYTVEKER